MIATFIVPPPPMRGRIVSVSVAPAPPARPELPDGLWWRGDRIMFECLACECAVELPVEPKEFDPDNAYCGGSPRCLP